MEKIYFKQLLREAPCDALLVSSPINIEYLTGYSNFSRDEREAYLFITKSTTVLFTDFRYIEAVKKIVPSNIRATTKNYFEQIEKIVERQKIGKVGFENNLTFTEYKNFKKGIPTKFILVEDLIENLRAVKDDDEIKKIKKTAWLTDKSCSYIIRQINLGVTEKEIAWRIEKFIKENDGELAFETIVAFGTNSAIPHHLTSDKKLVKSDEFILLDFGAKVDGYCSDMTRTFLTKKAGNKARKMYQTVLNCQEKIHQSINRLSFSGEEIVLGNLAKIANDYITSKGFPIIPHGLGHGIGLEVHEKPHLSPKAKDTLITSNYFSIEPGIYIPGFGGVRIEDDYLMTKKGLEKITKSDKKLIEI